MLIILLLLSHLRITILQHTLARVYHTKIQELMSIEASRQYELEEPRLVHANVAAGVAASLASRSKILYSEKVANSFDLSPKVLNTFHNLSEAQKGLLFLQADAYGPSLFTNEKTFEFFWRACHYVGVESAKYFQDALLCMNVDQRLAVENLLDQIKKEAAKEPKKEFLKEVEKEIGVEKISEPVEEQNSAQDISQELETVEAPKVKKDKKSKALKNKHDKLLE